MTAKIRDKQKGRGTLCGFRGLGGAGSDVLSDRWTPCSRTRTAVLHIAASSAPERGGAGSHEHNGRDVQARRGTLNRRARQRDNIAERLLGRVGDHSRAPPLVVAKRAVSSIAMVV